MSENVNHGLQTVGNLHGDIAKLEQKFFRIETLNLFHEGIAVPMDAHRIPDALWPQANWRKRFWLYALPTFVIFVFYRQIVLGMIDLSGIDRHSRWAGLWDLGFLIALLTFIAVHIVGIDLHVRKTHRFIVRKDGIYFRKDYIPVENILGCEIGGIFGNIVKIHWIEKKDARTSTYRFTNRPQALLAYVKIKAIVHNAPSEKRGRYGAFKY